MRRHRYPRALDVSFITRWDDLGWRTVNDENHRYLIEALSQCIQRLGLPDRVDRMRRDSLAQRGPGGRPGREPDPALRGILIGNLRLNGYIYRHGEAWRNSPLTARQLHCMRVIAAGGTTVGLSLELGVAKSTVRQTVEKAMKETGCHTTAELVAAMYRYSWLPNEREANNLRKNLGPYVSLGYVTY